MVRKRIVACLSLTVVALLAAAWVANIFGQVGIGTRSGQFDRHVAFRSGSLSVSQHGNFMRQGVFWSFYPPSEPDELFDPRSLSARLRFRSNGSGYWVIEVPIILLLTAMIPLVVGSFSGFRFRLWQLLAFTALVGFELAFVLRK